MAVWAFPATFTHYGNGEIVVQFVHLPEAITGGWSEEEAYDSAVDALDEAMLGRLARGDEIPEPLSAFPGERLVPLNPITAARCEVLLYLQRGKLSKVAAANILKKDEKVVRRILDGEGRVNASNVLDALRQFGIQPALTYSGMAGPEGLAVG